MLSGEKILVTGASGLVGMEIVRTLAKDNEVWGLSRYLEPAGRIGAINAWAVSRQEVEAIGVRTFAADLLGDMSGLPTDFTYLIHLAHTRLPHDRLDEAISVNSLGAGRLMHHCRTAKAALIMSSTAVYTPPADVWRLLKEGDPLGGAQPPFHNVTSPASKISLEAVSQFCATEFGLRTIIMRAGVVYGPNGGLPTRDLQRIVDGETLDRYGDPYVHSPIHFDDMNDQLEALLDAAATRATIVNWCGDEVVTQRQWCEQAAAMSGQPLKAEVTPGAPGDACNPMKRRSITGPCATSFADRFAEVYRAHRAGEASVARQLEISRQNSGNFSPG
jgi:nucleoside-diphosphate-sugar epimerase